MSDISSKMLVIKTDDMILSNNQISDIYANIEKIYSMMCVCKNNLGIISNGFDAHIRAVNILKKELNDILLDHKMAIESYSEMFSLSDSDGKKIQLSVFDLIISGQYGMSQMAAYDLYKKYCVNLDDLTEIERLKLDDIMKQFSDYSSKHDFKFYDIGKEYVLYSAGQMGCGIAANTNVIIDYYSKIENGEQRFLDDFDIPMYYSDEDGNKYYNYEALFIQGYLKTGLDELLNLSLPSFLEVNPLIMTLFKSQGLTSGTKNNTLKNMLDDKVNVSITTSSDISVENYEKNINNCDYCNIGAHIFSLKPLSEECKSVYGENILTFPAGHFMTVTGLSENGNYIVSSWGYQFELTDCEYGDLTFIKLEEKNE